MIFGAASRRKKLLQQSPPFSSRRLYAVGDIHGRLDLLDGMLATIWRDLADNPVAAPPLLIFLGDYIDRGPNSLGVVERLAGLSSNSAVEVHCLKGNHEQVLLRFLADWAIGPAWVLHGGDSTLRSYGVAPPGADAKPEQYAHVQQALKERISPSHLAFFQNLKLYLVQDDYAFVHAGIRWGISLENQREDDLLWIRDNFLSAEERSSHVIVHGHTPDDSVYIGHGRIGLDTGAYATGRLSAICLEGYDKRVLGNR
jgi:serine/threonine protein phosphatase 1